MAINTPVVPEHTEAPEAPRRMPPQAPPRPKKRSFTWLWLLILAGLGFWGWRYWQAAQAQQKAQQAQQAQRANNRPVSVVTAPIKVGDIPVYLRGLGSVTAFNTVTVKSRVDGQLTAIHFTEGQFVKQGELLAEIDPRPYQVQLEQAQGQLAKDEAQLRDAQVNLSRYQTLWNEQVIAKQQLDTQAASVGQFQGVIESDKGTIDNAKLQLVYSKITAPISGRIGLRLVDVGNIIHAADPNGLLVIAQLQPITVLFNIPADNLPAILSKLRSGIKLRADAYDRDDKNKIASGTLLTVDNQIDPTTGTSRLKAIYDNKDNALFPNQFVNVRLLLETRHGVVIVPAAAIQRGPQGTFVYLAVDGQAKVQNVTTGITEGDDVAIDQGLTGKETVIVEGQDKLQDGSKIETRAGSGGGRSRKPKA